MIKPERLKKGDTIAVLSPSWGGPSVFPELFELGLKNIKDYFGLNVIEFETARMDEIKVYENPKLRAEDINRAFADKSIKAIISSIGGSDSVRILPYLDKDLIKNNPKIFLGFSDTTTILTYINQLDIVSFYGPSVMAGFAQLKSMPEGYIETIRKILFENTIDFEYKPFGEWSEGYPDWKDKTTHGQVLNRQENKEGWVWIQGEKTAKGRLFGGCIEVLEFLKGTKFWPHEDFWSGRILFFESSEDKPTVTQVSYMLRNYGMQGILHKINGIIFGRPMKYSSAEKKDLYETAKRIVSTEFALKDMPILGNFEIGHTSPQYILPLGAEVELNLEKQSMRILEDVTAC